MAVRNNLTQVQKTREKIASSQLVNRLIKHALGEVEMTPTQVSAALGLIRKTMPDLKSTELAGPAGGAIEVDSKWTVEFINASSESK